jgi:hypothetical protein
MESCVPTISYKDNIKVKYYFDNTNLLTKYGTLWDGFLNFNLINQLPSDANTIISDILVEICDINFFTNVIENNIYISLDTDSYFYYYDFEKTIKSALTEIEKKLSVKINHGEFNATEVKHYSNIYKYIISKNDDNSILLKKKTLNWDNYEEQKLKKKKKKSDQDGDVNNTENKLSKMVI